MKPISVSLIVTGMLLANITTAQDVVRPKHEINLGVTNLLNRTGSNPVDYYTPLSFDKNSIESPDILLTSTDAIYYPNTYNPEYTINPRFGIGYKFHFGKNAARLLFSFGMKSEESDNQAQYGYRYNYDNSATALAARIGYERTLLRLEKFDFYIAADYILMNRNINNNSTQESMNEVTETKNESKYMESGAGLSLGMRYFIHKHISFSTETRIDYVSYEQKYKSATSSNISSAQDYSSENKYKGTESNIKPLAIFSVNVHF